MNINTVHMTGNLTDDPELRYTPSGKPVVSASIANNEHYTITPTPRGKKRRSRLL
jgi:single-stranded DNA-binding protein